MVKLKLVYVDDEQVLLEIFRAMFGNEYDVRVFNSSTDALEDIKSCEADVVISDLAMPVMSGIELLKEVSRVCPESVRVVLSGFATAGDMIPEVASGLVQFFIAKPLKEGQLREVFERAGVKLKARLAS